MATSSSLSVGLHDYHISIAGSNRSSSTNTANANNEAPTLEEGLCCFVCDIQIQGRHYALATCKTQSSRSRVIEKLGELVGDRYMVVICEDDVICRSCANLINTLDRLETEMHTIKHAILRFLENKYSLIEGELVKSSSNIKLGQTPRITKKRDNISDSGVPHEIENKKSRTWIQCDKCKYTTQHNSFMIHHMRDHIKQKLCCDKCGVQFLGNCKQLNHKCKVDKAINHIEIQPERKEEFAVEYSQEPEKTAADTNLEENLTETSIQIPLESHTSSTSNNIALINFPNIENLNMQRVLHPETTSCDTQPVYVQILPQINFDEGLSHSTFITSTNSKRKAVEKSKKFIGKQLLTLTEDGNLEMIEVTSWNNAPDASKSNLDPNIPF